MKVRLCGVWHTEEQRFDTSKAKRNADVPEGFANAINEFSGA